MNNTPLSKLTPLITTNEIGPITTSGRGPENADGSSITIKSEFFGNVRNTTHLLAGSLKRMVDGVNRTSFAIVLLLLTFSGSLRAQVIIKDVFTRNLAGQNIVLVDWEGYMANPAIKLSAAPPAGASFPFTLSLTANHSRLYFDMPSTAGAGGPSKTIVFNNATPIAFYLSIFPDRAGGNENYTLTLNSAAGTQNFPLTVIDQDSDTPVIDYPIILDFSKDNPIYRFFTDATLGPTRRAIVRQATDDWAFFLSNMNFDAVPAGYEQTYIFNDDFAGGTWVTNTSAYTGFLLYPHGIHISPHRSGGGPSLYAFQHVGGNQLNLCRSGTHEAEVHGNFNTLGWNLAITDNTWFIATNLIEVQNDYYSVAMHEIGHALGFNAGYPAFDTYKTQGYINNAEVVAYQGANVPVNVNDHLTNGNQADELKLVDRVSLKGPFGSEHARKIPWGRWMITKLNLLCMKAVGYNLKQTSAFIPPSITTAASLPGGTLSKTYTTAITAVGGIPFYDFTIVSGTLPTGLVLNRFTGVLSGTPSQLGIFNFTVQLADYDNKVFNRSFSLAVDNANTCTLTMSSTNGSVALNPFGGTYHSGTVVVSGAMGTSYIIFDMSGRTVRQGLLSSAQEARIDLSAQHRGMYVVKAAVNRKNIVQKVFVR